MEVTVDGKNYSVVQSFGDARAIINFDGVFVFVDANGDGTWDLSGEPARDGAEKEALAALTAPMDDQTILTITKD